jgi:ankyrin repeat protein
METKTEPTHQDDPLIELIHAVTQNDSKTVKFLLIQHSDQKKGLANSKTKEGLSMLHLATKNNGHYILQLLLEAGALVDTVDKLKATSLHWAASHNFLEACEVLCNYGASVVARDDNDFQM